MTERVKHKIVRESSYEFLFFMFVVSWVIFSFLWAFVGWVVLSFNELEPFILVFFIVAMFVLALTVNQVLFFDWREYIIINEKVIHEIIEDDGKSKKVRK